MYTMLRVLLVSGVVAYLAACGGGGGAAGSAPPSAPSGPQTGNPPPTPEPDPPPHSSTAGVVHVTAVDVFGAPVHGATVGLNSTGAYQQEFANKDGQATFTQVQAGDLWAAASLNTRQIGFIVGTSVAEMPVDGHLDFDVIARPSSDPVFGTTNPIVDPGGVSADGRALTFRVMITRVAEQRLADGLGLEVELEDCSPNDRNDAQLFHADCIGGPVGFDAAYEVGSPATPWVFETTTTAGSPYPFTAALLVDQSERITSRDPSDARLYGLKYFLLRNRASDRVAVGALGASNVRTGSSSPLPEHPVTIYPLENGQTSFPTIDALARLEGGVAPLYAGIDKALDYMAANSPAAGQSQMIVTLTDGHDDTCGTPAECRDARGAVVKKSLTTGIEVVTVALDSAAEDQRTLTELATESRGRSFWITNPQQLAMFYGLLPDVLSYYGEAVEVSFRIEASTAGAFQSGRTVFGTLSLQDCPYECSVSSIPIAVRIP